MYSRPPWCRARSPRRYCEPSSRPVRRSMFSEDSWLVSRRSSRSNTLEKDIFRGAVHPTALQRTFGGQVAGQSLVSAVSTVDESYHVHSLHGYFLRPGNPKIPTVYLVDRIRDGRSFCTRRVNAVQDGKTIFTMSASFHVDDEGIEHQDRMPSVPAPEDLPDAQTVPKLA